MKKYIFASIALCFVLSATAAAQTGFKSPEAAAKALYAAWKVKSKAKAWLAADNKAIDKLYGARFQPKWKFAGCNDSSDTEKGLYQCIFKDKSDDILSVAFDTVKTKRGWRVRWLTFGAES